MEAQEFNPHRKESAMKKKEKKPVKANQDSPEKEKKQRSYISDMMRRDRKACAARDKELARLGIKTECKDLVKDDPCNGCSFAVEANRYGPFDPPFVCAGIPRILQYVNLATSDIVQAEKEFARTKKNNEGMILKAQSSLLEAAGLISKIVSYKKLDCISGNNKPECFTAMDSLENFLKK